MKIRKLIIKNYKIFDDVEFDFTDAEGKTLDTVVLAGVNGCGKTTVLEVIVNSFLLRGFKTPSESTVEVFLDANEDQNISNIIYFPANESIQRKLNQSPTEKMLQRRREELKDNSTLRLSANKDEMKRITLKHLHDEIFKARDLPPQRVIETQIQKLTHTLSGLDLNTRLVDLESEELVFESANGQRIYFEQLSHGEQHLYFRAIYLSQLNLKDSIIMVDEPEAAFHPTWQQKIAQLYRNVGENNQVFMATHSPHIMASVPPECLFVLHIDESEGKRKIRVVNAAKAGQHSQGLEPNRILKEVMQVETLREYETQRDIERLTSMLTLNDFESEEAENLAEKLTGQLGRQDPFIIRLEHQMLMLRRKKENHSPAYAVA